MATVESACGECLACLRHAFRGLLVVAHSCCSRGVGGNSDCRYNIFVYGCAPKRGSPKERGRPRIFPHLLYRQSPSKPQEDYDYTRVHTVLDRLASEDASGAGGGTSNGSGSKAPARGGTDSGVSGSGGGSGGSGGGVRAPWSSSTVVPRRTNRNAVEQFPLSPEPMGVELEASMGHDNSTGRFSFVDCRFNVHPSKKGTGRVVCWRELHVANAFTMEASFCGTGDCSIIDKRYARAARDGVHAPTMCADTCACVRSQVEVCEATPEVAAQEDRQPRGVSCAGYTHQHQQWQACCNQLQAHTCTALATCRRWQRLASGSRWATASPGSPHRCKPARVCGGCIPQDRQGAQRWVPGR